MEETTVKEDDGTRWLVLVALRWDNMNLRLPFADVPVAGPHAAPYFAPIYMTEEDARAHFPGRTLVCVRTSATTDAADG